MDDTKKEFARHLAAVGYEPDAPRDVIFQKLRQRMGDERFKEVAALWNAPRSASKQEEIYKFFEDLVEGNLMRSLDPGATLDASYHLYQQCRPYIGRDVRVIELGCWTGGLASFIAAHHPECTVVGVDMNKNVVDACAAHYRLPNLSFCHWNYKFGKPEPLERFDLLLCSLGVIHVEINNTKLPDPTAIRRSSEYIANRDQAISYFGLWRSAAMDGARMYAVLRLPTFPRFLAWNDGAQMTGWTPLLGALSHAELRKENALPCCVFEAKKSDPLEEGGVLDRFTWFNCRTDVYACVKGLPALAAFRAVGARTALGHREYWSNGILTRDEAGLASGVGYVFTDDATSTYRLLLVSQARAKQLAAGIMVKDASTPISDDGQFKQAGTSDRPLPATGASAFFTGPSPFSSRAST